MVFINCAVHPIKNILTYKEVNLLKKKAKKQKIYLAHKLP